MSEYSDTKFPDADADLMLEVTQRRLSAQQDSIDSLDVKSEVALAVGSGLIVILAAVIPISGRPLGAVSTPFLLGSVVAYLALAGTALWTLRPRKWGVGVEPNQVLKMYRDKTITPRERVWIVAEGYARTFTDNREPFERKLEWVRVGIALLVLETICLQIALFALSYRA